MSIDCRTRRHTDRARLTRDFVFDTLFPDALERNAVLAARGLRYKNLPALSLSVDDRTMTLEVADDGLVLREGEAENAALARLDADALSDLVQDWSTTMGLAMKSRAKMIRGEFGDWIGWEPVFRAMLDGRAVHEAGAIELRDREGRKLDTDRAFTLDDDRGEMAHFLTEAGFLHIRNVFDPEEMDAVGADLDRALERAKPDDGASWWAGNSDGRQLPVRVLFFQEQSEALAGLLEDDRLQWLCSLTGDDHGGGKGRKGALSAEGLIKPLDIRTGLSDLPWHKDCGQGGHSYLCNALTVGISVTGADAQSGALGIVPGSHRANVQTAGKDESLDIPAIQLETRKGDLTVHCSDTLHRAHPPTERPRKVVYTGMRLRLLPGDVSDDLSSEAARAERARLSNVQERIANAGAGAESSEYVQRSRGQDA